MPTDDPTMTLDEFNGMDPVLFVQRDPESGDVVVALNFASFASPAAWGTLLADLVGHVANAYQQEGYSGADIRAVVIEVLYAELGQPTDKPLALRWVES